MILEVSRKQDYIFASKKLRENAQRSAQISYVTSSAFFRRAAGERYLEEKNLVYAGGGHTVLQFDGPDQARDFARQVTGAAMEATDLRGGAALIIAGLAAQGKTIISNMCHVQRGYEDIEGNLKAMGAQVYWTD